MSEGDYWKNVVDPIEKESLTESDAKVNAMNEKYWGEGTEFKKSESERIKKEVEGIPDYIRSGIVRTLNMQNIPVDDSAILKKFKELPKD